MQLSVIIPGYNNPVAWWKRCVSSVLNACDIDDEIICVDDGSDVPILKSWWQDEPRVRVIRKENGGLSSARNVALQVARGKYIAFIDSDDEILPEVFSRCIARLEETGSDICVYGVRVIWPEDNLYKDDMPQNKYDGRLSPEEVKELSGHCLFNYVCNKMYRRSFLCLNKLEFYLDGMPCEDVIFNLLCVMKGAKWCAIDYIGYVYYRTRRTLLSCYKKTAYKGFVYAAETWRNYAKANRVEGDIFQWIEDNIAGLSPVAREWVNIWLPRTPYSLWGRWKWLRTNMSHCSFLSCLSLYVQMFVRQFVRRYFYIKLLRRLNIKRMYPSSRNWKKS